MKRNAMFRTRTFKCRRREELTQRRKGRRWARRGGEAAQVAVAGRGPECASGRPPCGAAAGSGEEVGAAAVRGEEGAAGRVGAGGEKGISRVGSAG